LFEWFVETVFYSFVKTNSSLTGEVPLKISLAF
jgi:hypothetical protein